MIPGDPIRLLGATALAVAVSGCTASPAQSRELAAASPATPAPQAVVDGLAEDAATARARQLLASYGIAVDEYRLVLREPARWTDSSLGCRRPGEMYTQALVDGQVLRFSNSNRTYEVHVAGDMAVLCPLTAEPARGPLRPTAPARELESMVQQARADLAQRLGVPVAEIQIKRIAAAAWRDAALGCVDGSTDPAGPVRGYRLFLRARATVYVYHTELTRVMVCPPLEAQ